MSESGRATSIVPPSRMACAALEINPTSSKVFLWGVALSHGYLIGLSMAEVVRISGTTGPACSGFWWHNKQNNLTAKHR